MSVTECFPTGAFRSFLSSSLLSSLFRLLCSLPRVFLWMDVEKVSQRRYKMCVCLISFFLFRFLNDGK
ncbi:hypothetical protein niasHS_006426 [Heterodera schachtii]|uniref:Uncharacterized protein n=2 Tax=Heterodera TaxID=34509 RepID=A0ABD2JH74_HETSC